MAYLQNNTGGNGGGRSALRGMNSANTQGRQEMSKYTGPEARPTGDARRPPGGRDGIRRARQKQSIQLTPGQQLQANTPKAPYRAATPPPPPRNMPRKDILGVPVPPAQPAPTFNEAAKGRTWQTGEREGAEAFAAAEAEQSNMPNRGGMEPPPMATNYPMPQDGPVQTDVGGNTPSMPNRGDMRPPPVAAPMPKLSGPQVQPMDQKTQAWYDSQARPSNPLYTQVGGTSGRGSQPDMPNRGYMRPPPVAAPQPLPAPTIAPTALPAPTIAPMPNRGGMNPPQGGYAPPAMPMLNNGQDALRAQLSAQQQALGGYTNRG